MNADWFRYVLGAIVILLGIHQMELINFKVLQRQKSLQLKQNKNRQGGLLMLVYTLGLAIPFLILAFASSIVLRHFGKIKPYMSTLKKIGGALIILMGILLMLGNFNVLASIFGG